MAKATPSSIDRLPASLRELIGTLRRDGRTIDEIHAKLQELDATVSRSALGRHVKTLAVVQERMRQSRAVADSLVAQFGDEPDNKLARANIELMHSVVMQTVMAAADATDDNGEATPVTFDPEQVMFLSRSLQSLASAEKANSERILKAVERATKQAADKAGKAAKAKGLTKDTVEFITNAVLGVG